MLGGREVAGGGRGWFGGGGGGWHKASVSDCLHLAAPIGLSPLLILTLCGPERVLVVEGGGGLTDSGLWAPDAERGATNSMGTTMSIWDREAMQSMFRKKMMTLVIVITTIPKGGGGGLGMCEIWNGENSVRRNFGTSSQMPLGNLGQTCRIVAQQSQIVNGGCLFLWAFGWLLLFPGGLEPAKASQ